MSPVLRLATVVTLALLGGCATQPANPPGFAAADGWRRGKVIEVGAAESIGRKSLRDCRTSEADLAGTVRFASVQYRLFGRPAIRIARIDASSDLQAGDLVYVNIESCEQVPAKRS